MTIQPGCISGTAVFLTRRAHANDYYGYRGQDKCLNDPLVIPEEFEQCFGDKGFEERFRDLQEHLANPADKIYQKWQENAHDYGIQTSRESRVFGFLAKVHYHKEEPLMITMHRNTIQNQNTDRMGLEWGTIANRVNENDKTNPFVGEVGAPGVTQDFYGKNGASD